MSFQRRRDGVLFYFSSPDVHTVARIPRLGKVDRLVGTLTSFIRTSWRETLEALTGERLINDGGLVFYARCGLPGCVYWVGERFDSYKEYGSTRGCKGRCKCKCKVQSSKVAM